MRPGFIFSRPLKGNRKTPFDTLYPLFRELLVHTSGDVAEALDWLTELDKQYDLTEGQYGIGDFIEELKELGYLKDQEDGSLAPTPKTEQDMRRGALEQVFGTLKKARQASIKPHYPVQVQNPVQASGHFNSVMPRTTSTPPRALEMHRFATALPAGL